MTPWQVVAAAAAGEYRTFRTALRDPASAQQSQLADILSRNAGTTFGRANDFARLREIDAYRRAVPIQRYADMAVDVEAMCQGHHGQRVADPVLLYEQTGGSSGGAKTIPYTARALQAFRAAIHPWLHDLVHAFPQLEGGRAYWSISPVTRPAQRTADGIPIGMDNDLAYFGDEVGSALGRLSAVPPGVARLEDMEKWRYVTLRGLLDCDDLSLISVWSPTFLMSLLQSVQGREERLLRDIADGTVSVDSGLSQAFTPRPGRARQIAKAFAKDSIDTAVLWPQLALISCWTHGAAAGFIHELRRLFPQAQVQGKGLLATEGVISVPMHDCPYPVLALNSGFFEFVDNCGDSFLAHEVQESRTYRLVITTHSGLYRYDLGDQVRIRGRTDGAPLLEFVGRAGSVSDLCGEKLTETEVADALPSGPGFAVLASEPEGPLRYRLLLDAAEADAAEGETLARRLDEALRGNLQYDYARRVGQLAAIEATRLQRPAAAYIEWCAGRGQRLGDIKIPLLYCGEEWRKVFGIGASESDRPDTFTETRQTPWNPE